MNACALCRERGTWCYQWLVLCDDHRMLAHAYCWRKRQGTEAAYITPPDAEGHAYLCILCGYWHWTRNAEPAESTLHARVLELCKLFARTSFHINVARGWGRVVDSPPSVEYRS